MCNNTDGLRPQHKCNKTPETTPTSGNAKTTRRLIQILAVGSRHQTRDIGGKRGCMVEVGLVGAATACVEEGHWGERIDSKKREEDMAVKPYSMNDEEPNESRLAITAKVRCMQTKKRMWEDVPMPILCHKNPVCLLLWFDVNNLPPPPLAGVSLLLSKKQKMGLRIPVDARLFDPQHTEKKVNSQLHNTSGPNDKGRRLTRWF
ncbi:hypothetical protein BJ875DRAFT_253828 [Amylocarpus encephaloides]|uniref:Uncharacterized protein n=1 Tax=Amylocarpus encephaloides TaxID=45428 RepID=A0A9P7YL69_9HELO|nr:hypothetical protein BJ875DRAFT_253828 [Amylocarpus encephaloides]